MRQGRSEKSESPLARRFVSARRVPKPPYTVTEPIFFKPAADQARKSAAKFSLWLAASMLAGALAAALAAVEGGNLRNREWYLGK